MADLLFVLFAGVVLGVVQGIAEWLPISSKTQIIIVSTLLLGLSFNQGYTLGLFLELATFFAAVVYFRREVILVLKSIFNKNLPEWRLLLKFLFVATLVTGVMGIIIYRSIESLSLGSAIGIPMILLGAILLLDGFLIRLSRRVYTATKTLQNMALRDYLIIGFAQGLAAFPGVSRSGVTVSTMLLMKTEAKESFRLSFLALIPASIGATAVTLIFSRGTISSTVGLLSPLMIAVALVVAFVVGIVTVRWLLKVASNEKITTLVFALGALAIAGGIISLILGAGTNLS